MDPHLFGHCHYAAGLAFRVIGQGPRLVLIHGGSGSRTHWSRNVAELSQRFSVVTLDLPGFGESAAPSDDLGPADYLTWVADALRLFLGKEPFHMAGFSFGGAVAASAAARLARQGHGPRQLSLVSPAGFGKPDTRPIQLEKINNGGLSTKDEMRAATARNLGRWMLAREPAADDDAVNIHLQNVARSRFDSRRISHLNSLLNDLQEVDVPVQVLLGAADPLIFPSLESRLAALGRVLPGARVECFAGAGHWLQYEASEPVNLSLTHFHLTGDSNEL